MRFLMIGFHDWGVKLNCRVVQFILTHKMEILIITTVITITRILIIATIIIITTEIIIIDLY